VQRAKAIFGLDESSGRESYVGIFDETVNATDVLAAEAFVQNRFITVVGPQHALFEPEDIAEGYAFVNSGNVPSFLVSAP
jgi:hypothetical protein